MPFVLSLYTNEDLKHQAQSLKNQCPPPDQHLPLLVTRGHNLITNDGAGLQRWLRIRDHTTGVSAFCCSPLPIASVWVSNDKNVFYRRARSLKLRSVWPQAQTHCTFIVISLEISLLGRRSCFNSRTAMQSGGEIWSLAQSVLCLIVTAELLFATPGAESLWMCYCFLDNCI